MIQEGVLIEEVARMHLGSVFIASEIDEIRFDGVQKKSPSFLTG